MEMSGLAVKPTSLLHHHTPPQRYSQVRREVQMFGPLELGVALFSVTSELKFVAETYNFVINPLDRNNKKWQSSFFSASSVRFLRKNNFDFNRCFQEGLSLQKNGRQDEVDFTDLRVNKRLCISNFVEQIERAKATVVVHNGFFDLLHLTNRCLSKHFKYYQSFITNLFQIFPDLYDTKYIVDTSRTLLLQTRYDSSLANCYSTLLQNPLQGNPHHAGFDSYMTGAVFGSILNRLHYQQNGVYMPIAKILPTYCNRIRMSSIPIPAAKVQPLNYRDQPCYLVQTLAQTPLNQHTVRHWVEELGGGAAVLHLDKKQLICTVMFEQEDSSERVEQLIEMQGGMTVGYRGGEYLVMSMMEQ